MHPIKLRDYQIKLAEKGCEILITYGLVYLAMQTRTGKTITALEIAKYVGALNVLFVTKKKAMQSIEKDYANYSLLFNMDVINYESVSKMAGNYDLIIADEAHSLGAFPKPAKRVKDILPFCKGKQIIFLSATPSPESYSQLYHQFYISDYSPFRLYTNFYRWAKDFVNIKKKYVYNRELNDYSDANKLLIWQKTKHLFLTFTQEQAGFKQVVNEKVLTVPLPTKIKEIIKIINRDYIYQDKELAIIADTAAKVMQKTHQLCSGTVIDENGYNVISDFKARFIDWNFTGKKLAIFYKFKSELEILKSVFSNWTENAFEFQSSDKTFLGQFQSAREGIRLDKADAIIFYNIDFSYLSYEQAKNRIASFERNKNAVLYWIFSDEGIEKRIYNVVKNKQDYTLSHYKDDRKQIRASLEQKSEQKRLDFC